MDAQPQAVPTMRSPERWLAVLRIAVGLWFLKAFVTKLSVTLLWGFLPLPTASERWLHVMPILVGKYGEGNPVGFFRDFLQNTVIPHSQLFAQLTAFGEVAVGLGLTAGLLTTLAAGIGLLLRSEEHTSELQSPCNLVCRLLLEKKKNIHKEFEERDIY